MISLLFFRKKYMPLYDINEKLYKEVFVMKKFLRGLFCCVSEVIALPVSLIVILTVNPIMSVDYRINGEIDSFKEYWVMFKEAVYNGFKLKNMMIKYGFIEGESKFLDYSENEE